MSVRLTCDDGWRFSFVKLSGAEPFGLSTVEGDWGSGGIVIGFQNEQLL
jgi:hypothetical protein